jgi:hypothetical protein
VWNALNDAYKESSSDDEITINVSAVAHMIVPNESEHRFNLRDMIYPFIILPSSMIIVVMQEPVIW